MNIPDDWDTIGHEGYGPDLNFGSKLSEFSYTGTGYSFNHGPHLTVENSGYKHIKDGEYVRMTGQMKISLERTKLLHVLCIYALNCIYKLHTT